MDTFISYISNNIENALPFILMILITIIFCYIKIPKNKRIKVVNLDDKLNIRFERSDSINKYYLQFYNPIKGQWWYLPTKEAFIHGLWSFNNKGEYGHYKLNRLKVDIADTESIKTKFKTFNDIQILFNEYNKEYYRFKSLQENHEKNPIYIK